MNRLNIGSARIGETTFSGRMLLATVLSGVLLSATLAAPALAGGCTAGIYCGQIRNAVTTALQVGQDYNGSTVTGPVETLDSGHDTASGVDWDAFYLQAGSCSKRFQTAPRGAINISFVDHVNGEGSWVKVPNGYWWVIVKSGSCPR